MYGFIALPLACWTKYLKNLKKDLLFAGLNW